MHLGAMQNLAFQFEDQPFKEEGQPEAVKGGTQRDTTHRTERFIVLACAQ